jgi:hypothetical protein
MTPADALLAANIAANLATQTANNAQQAAQQAAQESVEAALAAAEAVRAAQAAQATASSSTRNYAVVPEIPVRLLRSRRGFPRLSKIFKKKSPILYRMTGTRRRQPKSKPRQTNKRKSSLQTVPVEIRSRSSSPEATHSSRRQRTLSTREYALPGPLIDVVPMDTTAGGGRLTDRKKTKKHRRRL